MSSSRNSSTSDSENLTENEVSACEESMVENSQHCSNYHYIIEQPNANSIRYLISSPGTAVTGTTATSTIGKHEQSNVPMMSTRVVHNPNNNVNNSNNHNISAAFQNLRDTNLLPSVTACGSQYYVDNSYGYKGYPGQFVHPYATNSKPKQQHHQQHFLPHHYQQEMNVTGGGGGGGKSQVKTGPGGAEYVSIRYFAPVSQVNPRLMKGEMINQPIKRETSRPKVAANVQYTPNIGLQSIDPSYSFNYNAKAQYSPAPQSYDFSPYRMLNYDMPLINQQLMSAGLKQQQQQQGFNPNGSSLDLNKSETHQSFNRPVSSLWNLAGGSGNSSMNQKFINDYSSDDFAKNYGNFFNSNPNNLGGNQPGGSFMNKFGNRSDKKSKTKFGLFIGGIILIAAIIGASVVLGIFLSKSKLHF